MKPLVILLLLVGCAPNPYISRDYHVDVFIHERDPEMVKRICGNQHGCYFPATRSIVIVPGDNFVLGHEVRHDMEGPYH